jgi:hypothetical protein
MLAGAETHGGNLGAVTPGKKKKNQAKKYFQAPVRPYPKKKKNLNSRLQYGPTKKKIKKKKTELHYSRL